VAIDRGLTHVAFLVADLDASTAFYAEYARMEVVHSRTDEATGARVAWVSDRTRPFVVVLIDVPGGKVPASAPRTFAHLGVGCASRREVDALCEKARQAGILQQGPSDYGPPVGYFGMISDPDGNSLEVSFGQEVGLTVDASAA
jgi:catechol 2,3-dioxygenase-like lactoylglutathione lyase family enzyme